MSRVSESSRIYRGRLGQTTQSTVHISTDSGAIFEAQVYDAINAAEDPELEESLFRGGLNRVESPFSDRIYHPAIPLRYHDPERRLFALVIPEALRHRELPLRRDLLESLDEDSEIVPDYVRNFEVVIGPSQLQHLADRDAPSGSAPKRIRNLRGAQNEGSSPSSIRDEVPSSPSGTSIPDDLEGDLEAKWEELEREREELEQKRQQLEEVSERIDRERRQMDEFEQELQDERRELESAREELEREREELEQERQQLEAERLRLEERERSLEQREESTPSEEGPPPETQVVTEDQFISVTSNEEELDDREGAEAEALDLTSKVEVSSSDTLEESYPDPAEDDRYVALEDGVVSLYARLDEPRIETIRGEHLTCFVQSHDLESYPIAAITLARLDDERRVESSLGWPLDPDDETHDDVLDSLADSMELELGLYDDEGEKLEGFHVRAPLEANVAWIRADLEERREGDLEGDFEEASRAFRDPEFERVGSMRYPFARRAFHELDTPSQVHLATGVVGYWSDGEVFEYLISNRSYPLPSFRELQEEVVDAALETGIYLNEPLRARALELGYADSESDMAERLLAHFAEVSVHIRGEDHDLDPVDEWNNWDALIEFAQEVGVTPDPEVVELAEASLQRARAAQRSPSTEQESESSDIETSAEAPRSTSDVSPQEAHGETQVVEHESEATGITYMVPDVDVIDTFEGLDEMSREDLEALLEDPNGRLEAAQTLLERHGASAVPTVMEATASMSGPELQALTEFIERRIDTLEDALAETLEQQEKGVSATYVTIRALAGAGSEVALTPMVEAYCDGDTQLDREPLARALATYGDTLVPPLTREIQRSGTSREVARLLGHLEKSHGGILDRLEDNRHDEVRRAAERAREMNL